MNAQTIEFEDFHQAIEAFHRNGWTDGLPVIPPTREAVDRFLAFAAVEPDQLIGYYDMRKRPIHAEKLAINAIMAGCLPEHFPVVIAIVEGLLDQDFRLHIANSSTGSLALGYVVNGPIRHLLDMNSHGSVLGPGNRANSSIGRAIRLAQINLMGTIGGAGGSHPHDLPALDRSTVGSPAKYTGYHIVENEEQFPTLTPLSQQLGYAACDSVVTVFDAGGHIMLSNHYEKTPQEWVDSLAHYLVGSGRLIDEGYGILMVPPEAAQIFVDAGWTKDDIRDALFQGTCRSTAWVKENGWKIGGRFQRGGPVEPGDSERRLAIAGSPKDIHVVVSGAPAGNFPLFIYCYSQLSHIATRKIRVA